MTKRILILQRVVGVLYIIAGVGKFFPEIESVEQRLNDAADANHDIAVIGDFTDWLAKYPTGVTVFVAAAMVVSGLVLIRNRELVLAALYGQLVMLVCFVIVLVSSVPQILLLDAAFFAAAVHLIVVHRRAPAGSAHRRAEAGADTET
ncbi:DoxX family membrane protein [Streptomyces ferrugineus]|uniref:DoxX family membrane protein n=1 Tax=Streptomyces ferrugineus TaxID=1413221 RepID=A0A7M2SEU6_9ACTN|nr:DUF6041 domain-containing protein [Streptomyces ferrugineus]QOV34519.1 DoxX family membrane protein [Streptomyces ferrugineus]